MWKEETETNMGICVDVYHWKIRIIMEIIWEDKEQHMGFILRDQHVYPQDNSSYIFLSSLPFLGRLGFGI